MHGPCWRGGPQEDGVPQPSRLSRGPSAAERGACKQAAAAPGARRRRWSLASPPTSERLFNCGCRFLCAQRSPQKSSAMACFAHSICQQAASPGRRGMLAPMGAALAAARAAGANAAWPPAICMHSLQCRPGRALHGLQGCLAKHFSLPRGRQQGSRAEHARCSGGGRPTPPHPRRCKHRPAGWPLSQTCCPYRCRAPAPAAPCQGAPGPAPAAGSRLRWVRMHGAGST